MKKTIIIIGIVLVAALSISISGNRKHVTFFETPIQVEEWMTHPFEALYEEALEIEDWMTKPFGG